MLKENGLQCFWPYKVLSTVPPQLTRPNSGPWEIPISPSLPDSILRISWALQGVLQRDSCGFNWVYWDLVGFHVCSWDFMRFLLGSHGISCICSWDFSWDFDGFPWFQCVFFSWLVTIEHGRKVIEDFHFGWCKSSSIWNILKPSVVWPSFATKTKRMIILHNTALHN